jgi:small subunit ribosomal protein S17
MTSLDNKQGRRQVVRGVVVSDKMTKTRVIEVRRTQNHRLYHKKLIHQKRLFVHDEKNESKMGDVVMAESTRPLSRHKNFRLIKIIEKRVAE